VSEAIPWLQKVAKHDREALRLFIERAQLETGHNGYVYYGRVLMWDGSEADKIGRTYNVPQRATQHRLSYPRFDLSHTISCRDDAIVEKALHYMFAPYLLTWYGEKKQELFVLPPEQVVWLQMIGRVDGGRIWQQCIDYCGEHGLRGKKRYE
jgi:hypothetical protein